MGDPSPTAASRLALRADLAAAAAGRADRGPARPGRRPRRPLRDEESVGLAFVSGLQRMPPQQRAVLVLRDVLGYRAAEVAEMLETSEASVNSALQRARAALDAAPERPAGGTVPDSPARRALLARFAEALRRATSTPCLGSCARTPGSGCRRSPTNTTAGGRSASSCGRGRCGGKRADQVGGDGRATASLRSPTTCPTRRRMCAGSAASSCSPWRASEIAAITRFGEGGWLPWFGLPRTLPGLAEADTGDSADASVADAEPDSGGER